MHNKSELKIRKIKSRSVADCFDAQKIQDEIFRKMSADRKIKLGSQLWLLGKELAGEKIDYGTNRSKATFSEGRANS